MTGICKAKDVQAGDKIRIGNIKFVVDSAEPSVYLHDHTYIALNYDEYGNHGWSGLLVNNNMQLTIERHPGFKVAQEGIL